MDGDEYDALFEGNDDNDNDGGNELYTFSIRTDVTINESNFKVSFKNLENNLNSV